VVAHQILTPARVGWPFTKGSNHKVFSSFYYYFILFYFFSSCFRIFIFIFIKGIFALRDIDNLLVV
jgi:hypothetical protein